MEDMQQDGQGMEVKTEQEAEDKNSTGNSCSCDVIRVWNMELEQETRKGTKRYLNENAEDGAQRKLAAEN